MLVAEANAVRRSDDDRGVPTLDASPRGLGAGERHVRALGGWKADGDASDGRSRGEAGDARHVETTEPIRGRPNVRRVSLRIPKIDGALRRHGPEGCRACKWQMDPSRSRS